MPGSDGLGILGDFWKKTKLVEIRTWTRRVPLGGYWMRSTFVRSESWDFDYGPGSPPGGWLEGLCRNSQDSKNCISLPSGRKTKSQEVNKRFVPELKKVVSVSGFLCIWIFYIFLFWICYTTPVIAVGLKLNTWIKKDSRELHKDTESITATYLLFEKPSRTTNSKSYTLLEKQGRART